MSYLFLKTVGLATVGPNDATEQSIFSETVPGGTLGTDKALAISFLADWLSNTGGNRTWTCRVKYGGVTVYTFTSELSGAANANRRAIVFHGHLVAHNLSGAQVILFYQGDPLSGSATGTADGTSDPGVPNKWATNGVSIDSSVNQTLQITAQLSLSEAALDLRRHGVWVEAVEPEVAAGGGGDGAHASATVSSMGTNLGLSL